MNKITPFLVILVVCLIALLFFRGSKTEVTAPIETISKEDFTHWKMLEEPNGEYQALFPTFPKVAFNNSIDPKTKQLRVYKLYAAEALDATVYLITEIQFPKGYDPSQDPTILETIVNELVANAPTNSLKEMNQTQFHGDDAVKFIIQNGEKMVIMGLGFIHNQSIFILSRVSSENKINQKEFDYFTNSFKFKNANKNKNPKELE